MLKPHIRFKPKLLEGHTGASPETLSKQRFGGVCGDPSIFLIINHYNYANSKWSKSLQM